MITIILSVIGLILVNLGFGFFLNKFLGFKDQKLSINLLLGVFLIVFLQTILAFVVPINQFVEIAFIILGLGLLFVYRSQLKEIDFSFFKDWTFYLFGLSIVVLSSFMPFLPDHFTYYNPTVNYISNYGFIKGISNVDLFLGQSSLWHVYNAGFSHFLDPFMKINAFALFVFLIFIYEFRNYFLLIIFPFFLLFTQQPSSDLPVFVLAIVVLTSIFQNLVNKQILLLFAVLAFCIKITAFWLPLFLFVDLLLEKKIRKGILLFSASFVLLLLLKNLYVFGFPFFPMKLVDLDLPWKANLDLLQFSSETGVILSFGEKFSYDQIMNLSLWERIVLWFSFGFKSFMNIGLIISFIIISFFVIKKKSNLWFIFLACVFLKIVLVIYLSSQFRFYVDIYFTAFIILMVSLNKKIALLSSGLLTAIAVLLFFNTEKLKEFSQDYYLVTYLPQFDKEQIFKPKEWEEEKSITKATIGNFNFNIVKHYIYKQPINSITINNLNLYYKFDFFPQRIKSNFKDGFYQRKLSPEERLQLKKIIEQAKINK